MIVTTYEVGQDSGTGSQREQEELLLKQAAAYAASNYMTRVYGEPRGRRLNPMQVMHALVETQEEMK